MRNRLKSVTMIVDNSVIKIENNIVITILDDNVNVTIRIIRLNMYVRQ